MLLSVVAVMVVARRQIVQRTGLLRAKLLLRRRVRLVGWPRVAGAERQP